MWRDKTGNFSLDAWSKAGTLKLGTAKIKALGVIEPHAYYTCQFFTCFHSLCESLDSFCAAVS